MPTNSEFIDREPSQGTGRYVLFENDFSTGMEGWGGLISTGLNYYPSLHSASLTGPHSLVIDTRGGTQNVEASASKRLMAFTGKWQITARIAWNARTTSGPEQNGLDKLRIALDWQRGTERHWWEVRYLHYDESEASLFPRWQVSDGSAANMTLVDSLSETTALDGTGYELGYNQINKFDFHEIVFSFVADVAPKASWATLKIDGVEADLSDLPANGTQSAVAEFDNGANLLFFVENRPTNSSADPYMLVDYVRVEHRAV